MYLSHTVMGVTSRSHMPCHRAVKRVTWGDPDRLPCCGLGGGAAALASVSPLNRRRYSPTTSPLLSPRQRADEKVAAASLFSDTVIVVLQWSALIIVYKYCVFMGNC